MDNNLQLQNQETTNALANANTDIPMGYDEDDADDIIIPRVKIIQALSPERKDRIADEGDILNSLTKEQLAGKNFIPVFKFNNNIKWIDRDLGGGIACQARDGKIGITTDGSQLLCKQCRANEFDNTKQGKDAQPTCTKYINFFGFFEGEKAPIILSFGRTNYGEGKKLYSLAKVTMQNIFNNKYELVSKEVTKDRNNWYVIDVKPQGATTQEDREYAVLLFQTYKPMIATLNMDVENAVGGGNDVIVEEVNVDNLEY